MAEAEVPTTVSAPVVSALDGESQKEVPGTLIVVFAAACGLSVANLYYAQPLLTSIEASFHVNKAAIGLVVTITQLGYAAGLLLLAPLGDLFENRRLITTVMAGTVIALLVGAFVTTFPGFLAASLAIGVLSVVAQILVPFAAHLAPAEARGRVVGQVMSGLLAGIVLARAFAGIVSGVVGWQAVYMISAILLAIMIVILNRMLPSRKPTFVKGYGPLIVSLIEIYRREPILRRRAFYQAAMFAIFSAFWTGITFLLSAPPYHFSQVKIGLFALAGVLGVLIAPIAGRLGDRGYERWLTGMAFLLAAGSFVALREPWLGHAAGGGPHNHAGPAHRPPLKSARPGATPKCEGQRTPCAVRPSSADTARAARCRGRGRTAFRPVCPTFRPRYPGPLAAFSSRAGRRSTLLGPVVSHCGAAGRSEVRCA